MEIEIGRIVRSRVTGFEYTVLRRDEDTLDGQEVWIVEANNLPGNIFPVPARYVQVVR